MWASAPTGLAHNLRAVEDAGPYRMFMDISKNNKLIVIAGPTASGKTRLGIELARALEAEIVSADSMQVYKRMDIGTAKADERERAAAGHHMLDVAEPWENYSVARYVEDASRICDDILARGKTPILVGGTGLYIDSLIAGRDFADNQEDMALRRELDEQYEALGGEKMRELLSAFDPERAAKLAASDRRRIIRAIEIYRLTGISATEHDRLTRLRPPKYDAARIVLNYKDRADLYARIDRRVEMMDELGLFDEIEALLKEGLSPDCTAMQAIGYKEAVLAVQGKMAKKEAIALIQQNSRRYAKRQLTWFRRWENAHWIEWDTAPDFEEALLSSTKFLHSKGYHNVANTL